VHNLIFSMPPGTPATKVLQAARQFATNEWALKHRYTMVLHTNESHPHVLVVGKARSEQGPCLNIRKAMLRDWRQQFEPDSTDTGWNNSWVPNDLAHCTREPNPVGCRWPASPAQAS
jgi:hypothetical protein